MQSMICSCTTSLSQLPNKWLAAGYQQSACAIVARRKLEFAVCSNLVCCRLSCSAVYIVLVSTRSCRIILDIRVVLCSNQWMKSVYQAVKHVGDQSRTYSLYQFGHDSKVLIAHSGLVAC